MSPRQQITERAIAEYGALWYGDDLSSRIVQTAPSGSHRLVKLTMLLLSAAS